MWTKKSQMSKLGLEKEEEQEVKLPTFAGSWIKQGNSRKKKKIYLSLFHLAHYPHCVDHNKLWKALKEMGIPDHLTCPLRSPYVGQEATVTTLYATSDWLKNEEGVRLGCLLSPCLLNLYPEHSMRNEGLDGVQAGIKTGGRNIISLRHAGDATYMAESEKELKSLLMRMKEESERASLKVNIKKS